MLVKSKIICMRRKISKICYASVLLSTLLLFLMVSHYRISSTISWSTGVAGQRAHCPGGKARLLW